MAGGVLRRSGGDCLLSHGCAVPAPPEGKPRALPAVLAPRIYEGGGPRSGRGSSPPQRESLLSHGFACQLSRRESQGADIAPRFHSTGGFPRQCALLLGMTGYLGSLHTGWFSRNGSLFCSGQHRTIASASLRRLFAELRGAALGFLLFTLGHGQFIAAVVFFVGGVTLDPVGTDLMELT